MGLSELIDSLTMIASELMEIKIVLLKLVELQTNKYEFASWKEAEGLCAGGR